MSENRSFLNEKYTQLLTEIRNHLWKACTMYNNKMPKELKDLLGHYQVPCTADKYNIHENMVHTLDHIDKLLAKINIDLPVPNDADIDLGIDTESGEENKLWVLTFTLDNGATWHEYNAVVKASNEDLAKKRIFEIGCSLDGDSYIPEDSIKALCIDKGDFICFSTIPHYGFKNNNGGKE